MNYRFLSTNIEYVTNAFPNFSVCECAQTNAKTTNYAKLNKVKVF